MVVLERDFLEQGDICMAKAFDDRVGCFVALEAMRRLKKVPVDVYVVGTTQEEVGVRGAYTAARGIVPDLGIALDVTAAFDVPGVAEHEQVSLLGNGTAIKIADAASISNHGMVKFLQALARKHRIKHQFEILPFGGTDASAMQRNGGGAVCTLSVPTRYVHSPNEILHKKDLEATISSPGQVHRSLRGLPAGVLRSVPDSNEAKRGSQRSPATPCPTCPAVPAIAGNAACRGVPPPRPAARSRSRRRTGTPAR